MFNFGGSGFPFGGFEEAGGHPGMRRREPVDTESYYKLLGLEKNASASQIKKSFNKLARTMHPDKLKPGEDVEEKTEKFKEIQEAYAVLRDEEKRALYDEGGKEAVEHGTAGGGGGGGVHDLFDMLSGRAPRGRGGPRKRRGEDVVFPLRVTLENLYNGMTKKLRLTKNVVCLACAGQGTKSGRSSRCQQCSGTGHRMHVRQIGPGMIQQMQVACRACNGTGDDIPESDQCGTCKGKKTRKERKTLEAFVDKGMRHNQKITFTGEADQAPDTEAGDVVVVLQELDHPVFGRDGMNLLMKKKISLLEALCGTAFTVTHLDQRKIRIDTRKDGQVIKPGQVKSIENEGMPRQGSIFEKGHLFIEFEVEFPPDGILSQPQKNKLKHILPPALHDVDQVDSMSDHDVEDVELTNVSQEEVRERQRAYAKSNEAYDEDDEDHDHGHGPTCRQQ